MSEALHGTAGNDAADARDFSISLESNSYGLYTRLKRAVKDDRSKRAFGLLAEEERHHLNRMTSLIGKKSAHVSLDNDAGIG